MATLDESTLDTMNNLTDKPALDDPTPNMLNGDDTIDVDYDAPERASGPYVPQVYPGVYPFLFALEDDTPFEVREYDTKKGEHIREFTVNHKATISITDAAGPKEVTIRFNRAGFHQWTDKNGNKLNSQGGELLRSLNIKLPPRTPQAQVKQALQESDSRVMGRGVVNWEAYCKACKEDNRLDATWSGIVSTKPRTKKGDARWPKEHGRYVTEVKCPKCGAELNGRERITDYRLPQE